MNKRLQLSVQIAVVCLTMFGSFAAFMTGNIDIDNAAGGIIRMDFWTGLGNLAASMFLFVVGTTYFFMVPGQRLKPYAAVAKERMIDALCWLNLAERVDA